MAMASSYRHWFSKFLVINLMLMLFLSSSDGAEKVTMSLYYETLCPFCASFIVNSLAKLFEKDLISIVNLRLVPFGNGHVQSDGTLICQHGPDECMVNAIEACAINIYPDVGTHFKFIDCVEQLVLAGRHNDWTNCLGATGLGNAPVDCYNSGNGIKLERRNADETARLNPPHRFVPWVVVNNQPLREDFEHFVAYVCKAYKGNQVPEACRLKPTMITSLQDGPSFLNSHACYVTRSRNSTLELL